MSARALRFDPANVQAHDLPGISELPEGKADRKLKEIQHGGELKTQYKRMPRDRPCRDAFWLALFLLTAIGVMGMGVYFFENIVEVATDPGANPMCADCASPPEWMPKFSTIAAVCIASCMASTVAAFLYVSFARRAPTCVVYTSLFFGPCLSIVVGLGLIYAGLQTNVALALVGLVFVALGICNLLCCFCCWRHLIPFMIQLTEVVADVIEKHTCMIVIAIIGAFMGLAWTIVSSIAFAGIYLEFIEQIQSNKYFQYLAFGLFTFAFVWGGLIATGICHVTYCGVFARWYFGQNGADDSDSEEQRPFAPSLKVAMVTSVGSICLGSFLVASVRAVETMARMARQSAMEDGNYVVCVILCIVECIISCIGDILEYFNEWAYVQCAIRGTGFCDSARITYSMITCANLQFVISDLLLGSLVSFGSLICALCGAAAGAGAGFAMGQVVQGGMAALMGATAGFFVGLITGSAALSIISSGVKTILVCWAEDPEPLLASHPDIHDQFQQKIQQKMFG